MEENLSRLKQQASDGQEKVYKEKNTLELIAEATLVTVQGRSGYLNPHGTTGRGRGWLPTSRGCILPDRHDNTVQEYKSSGIKRFGKAGSESFKIRDSYCGQNIGESSIGYAGRGLYLANLVFEENSPTNVNNHVRLSDQTCNESSSALKGYRLTTCRACGLRDHKDNNCPFLEDDSSFKQNLEKPKNIIQGPESIRFDLADVSSRSSHLDTAMGFETGCGKLQEFSSMLNEKTGNVGRKLDLENREWPNVGARLEDDSTPSILKKRVQPTDYYSRRWSSENPKEYSRKADDLGDASGDLCKDDIPSIYDREIKNPKYNTENELRQKTMYDANSETDLSGSDFSLSYYDDEVDHPTDVMNELNFPDLFHKLIVYDNGAENHQRRSSCRYRASRRRPRISRRSQSRDGPPSGSFTRGAYNWR